MVAYLLTRNYNLEGHIIIPEENNISPVYQSIRLPEEHEINSSVSIYILPGDSDEVVRKGFPYARLKKLLQKLDPDYVWLHAEFFQGLPAQFLWYYRFKRHPVIIAYFAANHLRGPQPVFSTTWPFLSRTALKQRFLWPRLNGVSACSTKAMECARRIGLPEHVPLVVNYLPVLGPEEAAGQGIDLPWGRQDNVIIGFAGLLTEQKGWKLLLEAMARLPERFKVVLAGDGPQKAELLEWLQKPELQGRAHYAGILAKDLLLATYPLLDVLVLPSISVPAIVEQFGAVLAEAMAWGVPVIGSDSGAIPEAVDGGGLIFPEGDVEALAQAILRLSADEELRQQCAAHGRRHYAAHYTCEAYAQSIANLLHIQ